LKLVGRTITISSPSLMKVPDGGLIWHCPLQLHQEGAVKTAGMTAALRLWKRLHDPVALVDEGSSRRCDVALPAAAHAKQPLTG